MSAAKLNAFESFFHGFVKEFGGEVLPEAQNGHTADYFFRRQEIIAELKTLNVDQTDHINRKLTPIVVDWARKNRRTPLEFINSPVALRTCQGRFRFLGSAY